VVQLSEEVDRRMDASRKEIQSLLAEFKNEIEMQYKKHLQSIKSARLLPE